MRGAGVLNMEEIEWWHWQAVSQSWCSRTGAIALCMCGALTGCNATSWDPKPAPYNGGGGGAGGPFLNTKIY